MRDATSSQWWQTRRILWEPSFNPSEHQEFTEWPISLTRVQTNVSENFWRNTGGYIHQRVPGAFEFDYVPHALFNLFLQGSYRVNVGLTAHTSVRFGSAPRRTPECVHIHQYPCFPPIFEEWQFVLVSIREKRHGDVEGGGRRRGLRWRSGYVASCRRSVRLRQMLPIGGSQHLVQIQARRPSRNARDVESGVSSNSQSVEAHRCAVTYGVYDLPP